jgi:hypothetical protein
LGGGCGRREATASMNGNMCTAQRAVKKIVALQQNAAGHVRRGLERILSIA